LLGALWSPTEACVCPPAVVAALPGFLHRKHGVRFVFDCPVSRVTEDGVWTADGNRWKASRTVVCSGEDFRQLLPEAFAGSGIRRCTLQMLKTAQETPELDRFGIHVMASQHPDGGLVLGDSHEYDDAITPFDRAEIDDLMLRELRKIVRLPSWEIAARWHGIYAKHPSRTEWIAEPAAGLTVMNALGGAGMTRSFAVAEDHWAERLG
jgi:glycine/D-amino acid oxidase-like deaminating enzyme